jgi:hypothetical protein
MMKKMKLGSANDISHGTEMELHPPIDVSEHFDGQRHRNWRRGVPFTNPRDLEGGTKYSEIHYNRDILSRQTLRPKDLQRYIDPADGKPRRLIVQATAAVLAEGSGDWRRTAAKGDPPTVLRLSSWALSTVLFKEEGHKYTAQEIGITVAKVLAACPCLVFLVMFPMGTSAKLSLFYTVVPTVSWEYPLYARNNFDASPTAVTRTARTWIDSKGREQRDEFDFSKQHARRLKPRYLVVRRGQNWKIEQNVSDLPYLMVSFTRAHFDADSEALYRRAAEITTEAGLNAYWVDFCIISKRGQEQTDDIHTICDVVRGARQVMVVVKDMSAASLSEWGRRMWTLAEVLLSSNELIKFCPVYGPTEERSRSSLATEVWGNDENARLLVEHFSGKLSLSRLELISIALKALAVRDTTIHFRGDLAYALMGLLGHRPAANPDDNLFQALARLSLANDSDRIVERMTCMLPNGPSEGSASHNREFILEDKFGANLWDIEPLCQVAGVCKGRAVILDGCRGAMIHWDKIPRIAYARRKTRGRQVTEVVLRAGPIPLLAGIILAGVGTGGIKALGVIILLVGLVLTLGSPWTIMKFYGGKVWGAVPWLIGIEGVLPIREVERMTFGNSIGRLKYAPSSSLLACKAEGERIGKEPSWIADRMNPPQGSMLPGQRLFTLIDTGTMTVSVFAAERPPSVALIAGREGGMLRVVLCSYERSNATLVKETVLRMETPMLDKAGLLSWVKVQ